MPSRPRTTFDKMQRERARQEKQAAKRARRHGTADPNRPSEEARRPPEGDDPTPPEPAP
jgi:hypothetical protein